LVSPPASNHRFAEHRNGGEDWTHRVKLRHRLASQQQNIYCLSSRAKAPQVRLRSAA
jgi:hypothetical protein